MFLFKSLCSLCVCGKHVSIMSRNFFPMFVVVLWLYGGLYHVMCLFLLRLLSVVWVLVSLCAGLYSSLRLYPLFLSASWYGLVAWLNMFLFDEIADNLWLIFSGMFLMMFGG